MAANASGGAVEGQLDATHKLSICARLTSTSSFLSRAGFRYWNEDPV
jgi:hypothetical protein